MRGFLFVLSGMGCLTDADADGDGWAASEDCDDSVATVNPGADETCGNGIDDDCDGGPGDCAEVHDATVSEFPVAFTGEFAGDNAGDELGRAGDFNADGYADLVIGVWSNDIAGAGAGAGYVVFGGEDFASRSLADADVVLVGEEAGDQAGRSISGAGDTNGDGYDDIAISSSLDDDGATDAGALYLAYGSADFASGSLVDADAKFIGLNENDQVGGHGMSGVGDIDGDGFDDVVVGSPDNSTAAEWAGAAYLVLGGEGHDSGSLADASATWLGAKSFIQVGHAVAGGGDFDGDGRADYIIGSPHSGEGDNAGAVWLIRGSANPGSGTTDETDAAFVGEPEAHVGSSAAFAGDVNGDGFSDLILGAHNKSTAGDQAGAAYIVLGTESPASLIVDSGDRFIGEAALDLAGDSVASAGDFDADGFADVLVGAPNNDRGGAEAGTAYFLSGANLGTRSLADADAKFTGTEAELASITLGGGADFNGDGNPDLVVGAPLRTDLTALGTVYVLLGAGL